MAIPPITNNPFFKLSGADRAGGQSTQRQDTPDSRGATPQDIVDISRAAQQRLGGVRVLETDVQARQTAEDTRDILKAEPYALGSGVTV